MTGTTSTGDVARVAIKNVWLRFRQRILRIPCRCGRTTHDLYHPKSLSIEETVWWLGRLDAPTCDKAEFFSFPDPLE